MFAFPSKRVFTPTPGFSHPIIQGAVSLVGFRWFVLSAVEPVDGSMYKGGVGRQSSRRIPYQESRMRISPA